MEDYIKRMEKITVAMASEALAKVEKKKKADPQDAVVIATYLNLKMLEEIKSELANLERGFQKIDALIDVVKQLKTVVEILEKKTSPEAVQLLREVGRKLDELHKTLTRE